MIICTTCELQLLKVVSIVVRRTAIVYHICYITYLQQTTL